MRPTTGILILISLLLPLAVQAYPAGPGEITLQASLLGTYDSNLLHYSDRDRERYTKGTEVDKSPIRAIDDFRTDYKLSAEFRSKLWNKRTTSVRGAIDFAHHAQNPIKNLGWLSLNLRQDISRTWIASAGYFYEPYFYIRDYNDSHTGIREHCDFALYQPRLDLTWRPRWLYDLTGGIKYKAYRYNEFFTEYDGDLWEIGLTGVWRPDGWRISVGYTYGTFENTGFVSDLVPPGSFFDDTEFGQGDYEEDSFTASARYTSKLFARTSSLEVSGEIANRAYMTVRDVFIDPMHSERTDVVTSLEIAGSISATSQIEAEVGFGLYARDADAVSPVVSEVKDYSRTTAWVRFTYEFK